MSWATVCMRVVDSCDNTLARRRHAAGEMDPAERQQVSDGADRRAPAGAQVSGSMNMSVRRTPPVAGSGKCPTAVPRRMASSAEVHASAMPTAAYISRLSSSWYDVPVTTSSRRPATIMPPLE